MVPRHSRETFRPVVPRLTYSMTDIISNAGSKTSTQRNGVNRGLGIAKIAKIAVIAKIDSASDFQLPDYPILAITNLCLLRSSVLRFFWGREASSILAITAILAIFDK